MSDDIENCDCDGCRVGKAIGRIADVSRKPLRSRLAAALLEKRKIRRELEQILDWLRVADETPYPKPAQITKARRHLEALTEELRKGGER